MKKEFKKVLQCFNFQKKNYCGFILILFFTVLIYFYPKPFFAIGKNLNKYSQGILALSGILGITFGGSWLDTSKKKMRGKLDYDIARKYLKCTLRLRDVIKIVRNPFISIGEMQSALEKKGFKREEYEDKEKVNRSVYSLRWDTLQVARTNFEEILTEAEVSWGDKSVIVQNNLDQLINKLKGNIWLFINNPETFNKRIEERDKLLYGTYDDSDDFAKEIDVEIEKIREFLKQYL